MELHQALPEAADQRPLAKFAKRRTRHRRPIPFAIAAAAAVVTTVPLFAEMSEMLQFDGGLVFVNLDDFTDAYDFTAIGFGLLDPQSSGEVVLMHSSVGYTLMFKPDGAFSSRNAEQVTYRVGRAPAQTVAGLMVGAYFGFLVESDVFLDDLDGAERIRYRIGDDGDTMEVRIPEDRNAAVVFFRQQVAHHSG